MAGRHTGSPGQAPGATEWRVRCAAHNRLLGVTPAQGLQFGDALIGDRAEPFGDGGDQCLGERQRRDRSAPARRHGDAAGQDMFVATGKSHWSVTSSMVTPGRRQPPRRRRHPPGGAISNTTRTSRKFHVEEMVAPYARSGCRHARPAAALWPDGRPCSRPGHPVKRPPIRWMAPGVWRPDRPRPSDWISGRCRRLWSVVHQRQWRSSRRRSAARRGCPGRPP